MKKIFLFPLVVLLVFACAEKKTEWQDLITNNSLDGWHTFKNDGAIKGWIIEGDNVLVFNGVSDMESGEGDASLLSDKLYENFEIKFDWQIIKGGNSGFMWGVQEDEKYNYPYQTGQEIQILDHEIYNDTTIILGGQIEVQNVLDDLKDRKHYLGALYDMSAPTVFDAAKTAGQWNSYHIKIDYNKNQGEVILNDISVNKFPLKGPEWEAMLEESKFSRSDDFPYLGDARWYGFGKSSKGSICFQDHPGKVSFRNIKIKELD